ncbi:MAG: helix-turn-helix domain-containing protein [Dehalococcoidales bacterium]
MTNETLIVLCWELYEEGVPKSRIAQRLGKHRETVHLWIKGVKERVCSASWISTGKPRKGSGRKGR